MDAVHVPWVFFCLMLNLCKIMQDSKHRAITQTIRTDLVGLFCDKGLKMIGQISFLVSSSYHLDWLRFMRFKEQKCLLEKLQAMM